MRNLKIEYLLASLPMLWMTALYADEYAGAVYLSGQWVKQDNAEAVKWLELVSQIAAENEGEAEDGCE